MLFSPAPASRKFAASRKLTEQHRQQMPFAISLAHPEISLVFVLKLLERSPRNVFGEGMKYTILMTHGIGLRFVFQTSRNV